MFIFSLALPCFSHAQWTYKHLSPSTKSDLSNFRELIMGFSAQIFFCLFLLFHFHFIYLFFSLSLFSGRDYGMAVYSYL